MMMMQENQAGTNMSDGQFMTKPGEPAVQFNSQGARIESTKEEPAQEQPQQGSAQGQDAFDDVIALGDTPLAIPQDAFFPATDDAGMKHEIISFGHVLKSTHDLARWSEKTGARRVNGEESIDSVSDLAINLEAPARNNAPVNNNGNNNGNRRGRNAQQTRGQQQWVQKGQNNVPSQIISVGPVLKSTHDLATWSEKRGANAVNSAEAFQTLDDAATNQGAQQSGNNRRRVRNGRRSQGGRNQQAGGNNTSPGQGGGAIQAGGGAIQAGGGAIQAGGGSSLQSGLDTQAGSHVQMDGKTIKETPEKAMEALHVHV